MKIFRYDAGINSLLGILFICILILFSTLNIAKAPGMKSPAALSEAKRELVKIIPEPELGAHSYLVKLAGEEKPLLKRREWKKMAPASISKLLTALRARELLNQDDWVMISEKARDVEEKRGPAGAGEEFLRDDAISLMLIGSLNDIALAIAETVGRKMGGRTFEERIDIFMALLNEGAKNLGLADSHFQNPSGLDEEDHYSTAEDLARLGEKLLESNLRILEISRTIEMKVASRSGLIYDAKNTNDLLKEFPAILGGKTGFTDKAKGALIFFYPVGSGKTALVVILGSDDRFEDGKKIIRWLEDTFDN